MKAAMDGRKDNVASQLIYDHLHKHSQMFYALSTYMVQERWLETLSLPNRQLCRHHGHQDGVSHGTPVPFFKGKGKVEAVKIAN